MKYLLARAVEKVRLRLKLEDLDGGAWPSAASQFAEKLTDCRAE
jgi:hypothetical protein